ncbi:MAG TPA: hypothetical protein VL326_30935, partial [Kofleriaceae bacterium]|nr:hypothetical protein [Kofleriaceae bacterium]
ASRVAFAQSAEPNTWRYDATVDGNPSSVIAWEGGNETFAGTTAFFIETVTISADGDKRIDERRYMQKTSAGIVALGARTASSVGAATSVEERVPVMVLVVLPAGLAAGAKWDDTTSLRVTTTPSGGAAASSTATWHVVGEAIANESVTVPAGTFDCIVIRDTTTTQLTQKDVMTEELSTTTSWYAANVGLVKSTTTITTTTSSPSGADPHKTESTKTLQLRSYRVPRPPWQMSSVGLIQAGEPAPSDPAPTEAAPEEAPQEVVPAQPVGPSPEDVTNAKRRGLGRRLAIVGGAILAGGFLMGGLALHQWGVAKDDCDGDIKRCQPDELVDAQIDTDAARNYAKVSTAFTLVGLAVTGTGIYLYVSHRGSENKNTARLQPSVTPNSATLVLSGSF